MIEETGANSLFIVMGFLEWSDSENEDRSVRSPLMLVPVRLTREGTAGQARYSLAFDDSALDTNYSLVEKLKKDFDITLPQIDEEEKPETYWKRISESIPKRHQSNWHVVREMALGLFRFNKQVMWHDLDPSRWPDDDPLVDKNVVKKILLGPQEGDQEPGQIHDEYPQDGENVDPAAKSISLIRDADSSQFSSLIDALKCDGGLVIEGPPGTGKSQTITNLIATALGQGLSVLFVAEKMAALKVVHKRLEESGLDPFCLQLHGLKTSKKELLESIDTRINYRIENAENLENTDRQLQQACEDLIAYSKVMSEKLGPEDLPLYDIVWKIEKLRQELPDEVEEIALDVDTDANSSGFNTTKNLLNDLGRGWYAIPEDARNAWSGYLPIKYNEKNEGKIAAQINALLLSLNALSDYLNAHDAQASAPELFEFIRHLNFAKNSASTLLDEIPYGLDNKLINDIVKNNALDLFQSLIKDIREYLTAVEIINKTFDYSSEESDKYAKQLENNSSLLSGVALNPTVSISSLHAETAQLQDVLTNLNSLSENSTYALNFLNKVARTIEDYANLLDDVKTLTNGPIELSLHANINHAKSSIGNYLEQAKSTNNDLDKRSTALPQFVISRIASSNEVQGAIEHIKINVGNFFAIFNGEYRKSKKFAKKILTNDSEYEKSEVFIDSLTSLYGLCKEREEFADNSDFSVALGSLFKGVHTDWEKLESLVNFSQKLRKLVNIEHATTILQDWDAHLETSAELKEKLIQSLEIINNYKESHPFPNTVWQRPVSEIVNVLNPWVEKIQVAADSLNQTWFNTSTTLKGGHEVAALYLKTKKKEETIESLPPVNQLLPNHWKKANTSLENLEKVEAWISSTLAHKGMHINILAWLFGDDQQLNRDKFNQLHELSTAASSTFSKLESTLQGCGEFEIFRWVGGATQSIEGFTEKMKASLSTISSLSLMNRWGVTSRNRENEGFGSIKQLVTAGILNDSQCGKTYEFWLYKRLFKEKVDSVEILTNFTQVRHEGIRERFAKLDHDILTINAKRIAASLAGIAIPTGVGNGPVRNYTQKRLLVHEANKKTKHIPIRQLVKRSGKAIKALKPCFLMSPLSVAQYLAPGDIHFDLVVMDEASQMRPEDALGAIARAGKSIIVGDPKQLPPTSFFDSNLAVDEDNDATVLDDTESILDVCLKQFPYRRLRWHYRSEHESLIQFSNDQFYDGDLIVFPSPKPDSRDYGVHFNFINNPSYHRGRNRHEAEVIVENIVHHYQQHSEKSLGVAAFNKVQADEIYLLLEKARQLDPAVDSLISEHNGEEPLFIKNLENVQGDERDVIFISTTYGPEHPGGPVAQRFGPINSEVGWRRLNVIATRAKQRIEIFSSMQPSDIGRGENPRRGVRALRDYLEFAKTGRISNHGMRTGKAPDSDFEIAVIKRINDLGYQCEPQVGVAGFFIDIGVINPDRPGEYLFGIECDGATYHSSRSVRDKDRLRQEILESKGWQIHRIWSTNWFHSRSSEIDKLKRVIQTTLDEDRNKYTAVADLEESAEVISDTLGTTELELEEEIREGQELLEEALKRFWQQNIQPLYPDRTRSILSEKMITTLVNTRPTTPDEWFESISTEQRQSIDPNEGEFRQDIFEIIAEYE